MPKVYWAHSKKIYGCHHEHVLSLIIQRLFRGYTVFNPYVDLDLSKIPPYEGSIMSVCYEEISTSNVLVATEYNRRVGKGVHDEIQKAWGVGIPTFVLRNERLYPITRLEIDDHNDWKVNYARVVALRKGMDSYQEVSNGTKTPRKLKLTKGRGRHNQKGR